MYFFSLISKWSCIYLNYFTSFVTSNSLMILIEIVYQILLFSFNSLQILQMHLQVLQFYSLLNYLVL